jgi:hypothetical protein
MNVTRQERGARRMRRERKKRKWNSFSSLKMTTPRAHSSVAGSYSQTIPLSKPCSSMLGV